MPEETEAPLPNRLRAMAVAERPQERLERFGAASLSDTELLAMLLRSGTRGQDVMTLATRLIQEAGSLAGLIAWHEEDFKKLKGIGRVKAFQLLAVMEIARRVIGQQAGAEPLLDRPDRIYDYCQHFAAGLEVEKFWVLCLNAKRRLLKRVELTSGTAVTTLAHPREVFRVAMREGASSIVCVHNHPSGDPTPSPQDFKVTRLLRESGQTVDIPLADHVIIGRRASDPLGRGYHSFREGGVI